MSHARHGLQRDQRRFVLASGQRPDPSQKLNTP
ncbi:hypothetical protein CBM2609_B90195 [Cupriavidus taiwanensis]|nr:hypothetical protein CBM2604_B80195 [Cupriavidus taiwanensis]SOZ33733.1 hypothetical protein CBM2609_B90195 [Cupriavidus taiwanensis]SOZ48994.1 hypothetical protein CBM2610_B70195 [Cupriavidus taiwanensis]